MTKPPYFCDACEAPNNTHVDAICPSDDECDFCGGRDCFCCDSCQGPCIDESDWEE